MDIFGIGEAVGSLIHGYFAGARGSGRTTKLIKLVQPGDAVFFLEIQHIRGFEHDLRTAGKDPSDYRLIQTNPHIDAMAGKLLGKPTKRVFFDHSLLEAIYKLDIQETEDRLERIRKFLEQGGAAAPGTKWKPMYNRDR